MSIQQIQKYLDSNFRVVFWPQIGDVKGPRDAGWPQKIYTIADYHEGYRVGLITGVEISPGRWLHDVDIDFGPGYLIALALLPATEFVFGREGKKVSHCFVTLPEALPSYRYEDIDKTCLIELRGTKSSGDLGLQTMVPPSIWSKDGKVEPLLFVRQGPPTHFDNATFYKQRVCLSAVGMICAKHLGPNGFGHEARLCWAGFLLRAGLPVEDLVKMGEAMSVYTNNTEIADVRRSVESTAARLGVDAKKVKGGRALATLLGPQGKLVIQRINEWLGRDSDFIRNTNGQIVAKHQENIRRAIELLGHELSYNQFADKLLFNGRPLEDPEWQGLYLEIDREHHFQPPVDYFKMVVQDIAWKNGFHPVKQYLDSLTWDGKPRLDAWLIQSAKVEDSPYIRAVSSIMLIAAVRRIRQPGCKYDELVIWESSIQGTDKSSAAQALCPDPKWFSDDLRLNLHSQQLIEATLGKWIIEASELSGKKKTEIDSLKAMLSRQVDGPARMAYAHFAVERARHFIIIGTTNNTVYLTDATNRRFWPMTVRRFNIPWITTNRDQLWAEACFRETAGESIRLHESLWPHAAQQQEKRREQDPWEHVLRAFLLTCTPSTDDKRRVPTNSLWDALAIPVERRDRYNAMRVSEVMQRLGFVRTRVRVEDTVVVGYVTEDASRLEAEDESREVGADDEGPHQVSAVKKEEAPF